MPFRRQPSSDHAVPTAAMCSVELSGRYFKTQHNNAGRSVLQSLDIQDVATQLQKQSEQGLPL